MSSALTLSAVLVGSWLAAFSPSSALAAPPTIAGCPAFPASNPLNQPVTGAPVDPLSRRYIATMSRDGDRLWTGANSGRWGDAGFVVNVVPRSTPLVPITIDRYPNGAIDPTAMPIPPAPRIQQKPDRHLLIVQQGSCRLYESWDTRGPVGSSDRAAPSGRGGSSERGGSSGHGGSSSHAASPGRAGSSGRGGSSARAVNPLAAAPWRVGSAATWDLRSNAGLPAGSTSADAAGLPITTLLLRADEVIAGTVGHALRLTSPTVQDGWVAPAVHPGSYAGPDRLDYPPMGVRLRLKPDVRLSSFSGQARVIVRTLQTYGAVLSDQTEPQWAWEISGTNDPRWNDDQLAELRTIRASDFEVLRHGPISRFDDAR